VLRWRGGRRAGKENKNQFGAGPATYALHNVGRRFALHRPPCSIPQTSSRQDSARRGNLGSLLGRQFALHRPPSSTTTHQLPGWRARAESWSLAAATAVPHASAAAERTATREWGENATACKTSSTTFSECFSPGSHRDVLQPHGSGVQRVALVGQHQPGQDVAAGVAFARLESQGALGCCCFPLGLSCLSEDGVHDERRGPAQSWATHAPC
jgi:hypothetical protein